MPILTRASRIGRHRLDLSAPLFVLRRIPCGQDATGAPVFLVPGAVFDVKSVTKQRLSTLFRSRLIGHAPPRSLRVQAQAIGAIVEIRPEPAQVAEPPPAPAKPAKPSGRRAGA